MYKLYFFILCLIVCTACGKNYKIEGVSSDLSVDGKMLFIKVPVGNEWINVDSAEVIHGLFKMKGRIDSTMMAFLYMDDKCIMPFVFETGNIDINIINIENAIFSVKGTTLNERFNTFLKKQFSLNERANEIERSEARMILNGENPQKAHEEVQKRRTELSKEIDNAMTEQKEASQQVLLALRDITDSSSHVQNTSKQMGTNIGSVTEELKKLESIGELVEESMSNISNSADGINTAAQKTQILAQNTTDSIHNMNKLLSKFKL